jgi:CubicO group peptidase (beta-lactamase class C family)
MSFLFQPEEIDKIVTDEMGKMKIPGAAVTIVKGDRVVYTKGFGRSNERGDTVTQKTAFYIGSSSKSFTAMAIMQLSERGLLNIDDPVVKYLPWFTLAGKSASGEITIRQLLNHTSGFSTYEGMKVFNRDADESLETITRHSRYFRISRKAGISYEYSNLNYVLAGEIIQAVSGISYEEYIEKNIFQPLEMHNSFASNDKALKYGIASGYQPIFGHVKNTKYEFHPAIIPAGYLVTCADDISHYLIANLNGGLYKGTRVLSAEGMDKLHTKSSPASDHYGLGWFDYGELIHHGGSCENYHATMMLVPAEKWGIFVHYNINDNISGAFVKGSFAGGETVSYDRIQSRIVNYLTQKETLSPIIATAGGFYSKMNTVLALLFILIAGLGTVYCTSSSLLLPVLITCNIVLPAVLLKFIPRVFKATWKAICRFGAGYGHAFLAVPIMLFVVGILKIIF